MSKKQNRFVVKRYTSTSYVVEARDDRGVWLETHGIPRAKVEEICAMLNAAEEAPRD